MYKILYTILLIIGIGSIGINYRSGNIKTKDIGVKALAVSLILVLLLGITIFIK